MRINNVMVWGSNSVKPKFYNEINFNVENNGYSVTISSDGKEYYDLINLDTDEWLQLKRMINLEYKQLDEKNIDKPEIKCNDNGEICRKIWTLNVKR